MTLQLPTLSWTKSPNYSSRGGARVRLIVAHDCEGSFDGSVSWFAMARSQVSAHIVLSSDGARAVQMVAWANKAWHVCDFNSVAEGIEMAGYAAKGFDAPEWAAAAAILAFRLKANSLPPVWAKGGRGAGFCSHHDLGQAGGGHDDPTTDAQVWAAFVERVQDAYAQPMPASWVAGGAIAAPAAPAGWKPSGAIRHDFSAGSLEWVQAALNALDIPTDPLTVDGIEGDKTRAAIEAFQARAKIGVDGDVGTETVAAIQKALAA